MSPALEGDKPQSSGGMRGGRQSQASGGYQVYDLRAIAVVVAVSTAFLDAQVKGKAQARRWLDADAKEWLGRTAALTSK